MRNKLILCGAMSYLLTGCLGQLPPASTEDGGSVGIETDATPGAADDLATRASSPDDLVMSSPVDAALPDAASMPDGAVAPSPCAGLTFCETFESYNAAVLANNSTLGPWKATVSGTAGIKMQVDTVKPYRGTKSLHITIPAGGYSYGNLNQKVAAGIIPGNNVFGRAMVFYSNTGGNALPTGHSWMFNASGPAGGGTSTMNLASDTGNVFLNYHPPTGSEQSASGGKITAGVWHCVQWQYDGSGAPSKNDGKVWIDGTMVLDAPASKGWIYGAPWSSFDFGLTHYQTTTTPIDVFLDNFALDEAMIPCPP